MTDQQWFKIHYEQRVKDKIQQKSVVSDETKLYRVLLEVFEMGIAYGMDEIVARIKDKGNLPPEVENELLKRLDS